jgi:hypothetical protein
MYPKHFNDKLKNKVKHMMGTTRNNKKTYLKGFEVVLGFIELLDKVGDTCTVALQARFQFTELSELLPVCLQHSESLLYN